MSYTRLGQIVLTDIASLRKAVLRNPELTWVEGATSYLHEGSYRKCVHKIKVVGEPDYEIGIIEMEDGSGYKPVWDSNGYFEEIIGEGACNINTAYVREVQRDYAAKHGFTLTEITEPDGSIVFTMQN